MRHALVAAVDLGAGSWAEVLLGSDDSYRILVHQPVEEADGVSWETSVMYGPYALLDDVEARLEALREVEA
jgi:hypothetical protein